MVIRYMGRRLNGRFDSLKQQLARLIRFTVRWSFISAAAYAIFMAGAALYSTDTIRAEVVDTTPGKIEALKMDVVARLFDCENAHYSEDDGIIIFDTNNKASIGEGQFQKATVIYYYKTLYGKVITPKEAVLIALDTQKAKELARDIIFKTKNGVAKDWVNCARKHNLQAEVDIIKKLEQ